MNNLYKTYVIHILLLILVCAAPAAGTVVVSVDDISENNGTIVDIPINVSDAPWQVGAMDISLTYNSSMLTALGAVNGSLTAGVLVMDENTITKPYPDNWTDAYFTDEADNQTVWNCGALANNTTATNGVVNISIISRYGFNGAGSIAVVRFMVTGNGTSPLNLDVAVYNVSAPIPNATDPNKIDGYESITVTTDNGTFSTKGGAVYTISLVAGWNLISIPVIPADASVGVIFGDKITQPVYEYDAGYMPVMSLEPKTGYWVLANSPVDIEIAGTTPTNLEVTVYPGWNLVGPVSPDVQVSSFASITPPVYGYDTGYKSAETLEQTKGYWVLASVETTLTV